MYFTYVLQGLKDKKYYIGSTGDLKKRLFYHNQGLNKSTRYRRPLEIVFTKEFTNKTDAVRFEMLLKKQKSGVGFKRLTMLG